MDLILQYSAVDNLARPLQTILSKCNTILIQIVKYEWNTTWRSFIQDICQSSLNNMNICENNFNILKMLSEEIFDHSKNQLTNAQVPRGGSLGRRTQNPYELGLHYHFRTVQSGPRKCPPGQTLPRQGLSRNAQRLPELDTHVLRHLLGHDRQTRPYVPVRLPPELFADLPGRNRLPAHRPQRRGPKEQIPLHAPAGH